MFTSAQPVFFYFALASRVEIMELFSFKRKRKRPSEIKAIFSLLLFRSVFGVDTASSDNDTKQSALLRLGYLYVYDFDFF